MQHVVNDVAEIAEKYVAVRLAARQVREIDMGTMETHAKNARGLLVEEPELGEQISRLLEPGGRYRAMAVHPQVQYAPLVCRIMNRMPFSW